ncbi:hypothetical protein GWM83_02070 [Candidatus Bathyarchaeota archaeon]|nr:hypothetical protein [Candidatus Bathyarchaeota archaeon]NIV67731.1 hypothetical protein [Candidatus Bathyarchaeota archaeon]NIW34336.1 hypothetical protein [Candidatus Bathyarchaeota archaeon]
MSNVLGLIWSSLSPIEKGLVLLTLAVYLLFASYSPETRAKTFDSIVAGAMSMIRISLLLLSGIFLGSLVGKFLPRETVAGLLGRGSGLKGILLGTLVGSVMPGGPYVLFPVAASLVSSGAAIPPIVAMIFAWSCIAITRIPLELGYLSVAQGQRIVWLRILLGIPLPIVAGVLAGIIVSAIAK